MRRGIPKINEVKKRKTGRAPYLLPYSPPFPLCLFFFLTSSLQAQCFCAHYGRPAHIGKVKKKAKNTSNKPTSTQHTSHIMDTTPHVNPTCEYYSDRNDVHSVMQVGRKGLKLQRLHPHLHVQWGSSCCDRGVGGGFLALTYSGAPFFQRLLSSSY